MMIHVDKSEFPGVKMYQNVPKRQLRNATMIWRMVTNKYGIGQKLVTFHQKNPIDMTISTAIIRLKPAQFHAHFDLIRTIWK